MSPKVALSKPGIGIPCKHERLQQQKHVKPTPLVHRGQPSTTKSVKAEVRLGCVVYIWLCCLPQDLLCNHTTNPLSCHRGTHGSIRLLLCRTCLMLVSRVLQMARLMLQDPAILLCDEATSALDSRTEKQILQALQALASGRTSLFVAHRLSTDAQCEQNEVLEKVTHDSHTFQGVTLRLEVHA